MVHGPQSDCTSRTRGKANNKRQAIEYAYKGVGLQKQVVALTVRPLQRTARPCQAGSHETGARGEAVLYFLVAPQATRCPSLIYVLSVKIVSCDFRFSAILRCQCALVWGIRWQPCVAICPIDRGEKQSYGLG